MKKYKTEKKALIELLNHYGYQFDNSNEYFINNDYRNKNRDKVGVKVGEFFHSCHIEDTTIFVLLFIDKNGKTEIEEVCDIWVRKV